MYHMVSRKIKHILLIQKRSNLMPQLPQIFVLFYIVLNNINIPKLETTFICPYVYDSYDYANVSSNISEFKKEERGRERA